MSNFFIRELDSVFIHIPKTGGTSIRKGAFQEVEGPEYGVLPADWQGKFKFAFVREPIERFLSCVAMFKSGTADEDGAQRRAGRDSFTLDHALEILTMKGLDFGAGRQSVEERFLHHAMPMTHPFNMLSHADYVGRFESLAEDYLEICRRCGVADPPKLPSLHRSRVPFGINDLSPAEFEQLVEYYRQDYEVAGYEMPYPKR